MLVTSTHFVL